MNISVPYGRGRLTAEVPDERIRGVLCSRLESYLPAMGETELVEAALRAPIGAEPLEKLAEGKKNIVLIASDHTRPVPSKVLVPPMLAAVRRGNPDADITILIATGCHRGTTKAELIEKFGPEIVERERIVIHDCAVEEELVTIGTLPSGGVLRINRLAAETGDRGADYELGGLSADENRLLGMFDALAAERRAEVLAALVDEATAEVRRQRRELF